MAMIETREQAIEIIETYCPTRGMKSLLEIFREIPYDKDKGVSDEDMIAIANLCIKEDNEHCKIERK